MTTREVGCTGIHISPIGLGCMQLSGVSAGESGRGIAAAMFQEHTQSHADQIIKRYSRATDNFAMQGGEFD